MCAVLAEKLMIMLTRKVVFISVVATWGNDGQLGTAPGKEDANWKRDRGKSVGCCLSACVLLLPLSASTSPIFPP